MTATVEQRLAALEAAVFRDHPTTQRHIDALCELITQTKPVARRVMEAEHKLDGLRMALCLLLGYEPEWDHRGGGRADQFVREWQARRQADTGQAA